MTPGAYEISQQDQDVSRPTASPKAAANTAAPHVSSAVRLSLDQVGDLADAARVFGCELVHLGMQGSTLQLVIDHPDGINVDHCANVSRQASAILDRDDFGASRYVLEVTSPGIERELFRPVDFRRFVGEPVRITIRTSQGQKRTLDANLASITGSDSNPILELTVQSEDAADRGDTVQVNVSDVLRAHLKVEF